MKKSKLIKNSMVLLLAVIVGLAFSFNFTASDVSALSKPGKVKIVSASKDAEFPTIVFVKWKKLSKNTTGYKVYRSTQKSKGYKCIATVKGKSKTRYEDDGLYANGKTYYYKVRAYNKKSGKTKYGKYSAVKSVKMPILWPVDPDVYLDYGQTRIFLGQDWDNTLCNQLKSASNGFEQVSRPGLAKPSNGGSKYYDVTKYMFDINDYDHFLAIEVAGGKIIMWETAGPTFGVIRGTTVQWGDCVKNYTYGIMTGYRTDGACNNVFTDIDKGDTVVGGFGSDYFVNTSNLILENEKRIGYHYINAYRVAAGRCILSYSNELDGKNYKWSGEANGKTYTNTRYGTQPFVETVAASKKVSHDTSVMTSGPLAGQGLNERCEITFVATGVVPYAENVATGGLGESCLGSYMSSSSHLVQLLGAQYTKVGLGLSGNYNAQEYSK